MCTLQEGSLQRAGTRQGEGSTLQHGGEEGTLRKMGTRAQQLMELHTARP